MGDFGHYRLKSDYTTVRKLRAVQIGLTVGRIDSEEPPKTTTYLVRPDGFVVTEAASRIHKIKHSQAVELGMDLRFVLSEFLREVFEIVDAGGRICAHQIEFDGAIMAAELARAGLDMDTCERWNDLLWSGLCSMNPFITEWTCKSYRNGIDSYGNGTVDPLMPCSLPAVAWTLLAPHDDLLQEYHNAGTDSRLCWRVVKEYHFRMQQRDGAGIGAA
jgi:hypothetical protein